MDDFAIREKLLRLEHEYTLQQVADGTGLSVAAISRYENGEREPNARVLSYFCKFYGVSADWFLGLVTGRNDKYGPDYVLANGIVIENKPSNTAGHRTIQSKDHTENEENVG